jgi:hypothetical protein
VVTRSAPEVAAAPAAPVIELPASEGFAPAPARTEVAGYAEAEPEPEEEPEPEAATVHSVSRHPFPTIGYDLLAWQYARP